MIVGSDLFIRLIIKERCGEQTIHFEKRVREQDNTLWQVVFSTIVMNE
jgi:hypothetical protein